MNCASVTVPKACLEISPKMTSVPVPEPPTKSELIQRLKDVEDECWGLRDRISFLQESFPETDEIINLSEELGDLWKERSRADFYGERCSTSTINRMDKLQARLDVLKKSHQNRKELLPETIKLRIFTSMVDHLREVISTMK